MLKELLLDILLPKKCIGCKKEGQYICKNCELFLSEAPNIAEVKPRQEKVMSVWEYEGLIERAILKIKYDGYYDIINELVEKAFEKIDLNLPIDAYITYVPMHKKKERQRGFNQAELIAKKIGQMTDKKVLPLLIKTKDNRSQTGLSPTERLENVKDVFTILPLIKAQFQLVLLVDDFYTTGATLKECQRVLKHHGAKNIWCFTLARELNV